MLGNFFPQHHLHYCPREINRTIVKWVTFPITSSPGDTEGFYGWKDQKVLRGPKQQTRLSCELTRISSSRVIKAVAPQQDHIQRNQDVRGFVPVQLSLVMSVSLTIFSHTCTNINTVHGCNILLMKVSIPVTLLQQSSWNIHFGVF